MVQTNREKTKVFTQVTSESLLPTLRPQARPRRLGVSAQLPFPLQDGIAWFPSEVVFKSL